MALTGTAAELKAKVLAEALPHAVNHVTPAGHVPEANAMPDLSSLMGRFFGSADKVPHHVITMGLGTIMEARQCLLLAFGAKKANAIAATVEGPLAAINPASVLQMHPNAKFCVDEAAAGILKHAEYYRWVYKNKPEWQAF